MILGTALTLASVGSQLVGSGMSFADARKQKKAQAQAEQEAEVAMNAARQRLEVNYMDSLAIQKEPYELERDAALVAGAQATEALRESDRGMGRVGAIYGQQQQAQRQIASAMGQEKFNLDYLSAQEDTRKDDLKTQLDLGEATGAQLAAANAEERRAQQLQAGAAGVGLAAATGLDELKLFGKTGAASTQAPQAPQAPTINNFTQKQRLANSRLGVDSGFNISGNDGFMTTDPGFNPFPPFTLTPRKKLQY